MTDHRREGDCGFRLRATTGPTTDPAGMNTNNLPESEPLADSVRAYMAEQMAMTDVESDQEENWIYGHMVTCAHRIVLAAMSVRKEP
jgi:hypothetical protein